MIDGRSAVCESLTRDTLQVGPPVPTLNLVRSVLNRAAPWYDGASCRRRELEDVLKPETLIYFLIFAVPGIVAMYVRAQFLTGRLPPFGEGLLAYVTLSLGYHALAYPIAYPLYGADLSIIGNKLGWFTLLFVAPAALGLLLGLNVRKGWAKSLMRKCGINPVHPVHCAWDWHFGNCKEGWVLAVLTDDTKWAGYLGPDSFISSDAAERDIFIEKVYEIPGGNKPWVARTSSVWLAHGQIRSIEFWPRR